MAYIREAKSGWRAEVARRGVRETRTFPTEERARAWAAAREAAILDRSQADLSEARNNATLLLSRIPRRVLEASMQVPHSLDQVLKGALPVTQPGGIYFLIRGGEVIYVGQSVDVFRRISRHRAEGRVFDSFNVVYCDVGEMDELEALYITAFVPIENNNLGNRTPREPPPLTTEPTPVPRGRLRRITTSDGRVKWVLNGKFVPTPAVPDTPAT